MTTDGARIACPVAVHPTTTTTTETKKRTCVTQQACEIKCDIELEG